MKMGVAEFRFQKVDVLTLLKQKLVIYDNSLGNVTEIMDAVMDNVSKCYENQRILYATKL